MDYSKKDLEIANIIYNKMKALPIGTNTSVSELGRLALKEHPLYHGEIPTNVDWWPIIPNRSLGFLCVVRQREIL